MTKRYLRNLAYCWEKTKEHPSPQAPQPAQPKPRAKVAKPRAAEDKSWYLDNLNVKWDAVYSNEPCDGVPDDLCDKYVLGGHGDDLPLALHASLLCRACRSQAGTMGLTILFASGDQGVCGREGCGFFFKRFKPDFPGGSPYHTSVGGTDFAQRKGNFNPKPGSPSHHLIMGLEVSGIVAKVGEAVIGFREGELIGWPLV